MGKHSRPSRITERVIALTGLGISLVFGAGQLAVGVMALPSGGSPVITAASPTTTPTPDLSTYPGNIDWARLSTEYIKFVPLSAMGGTYNASPHGLPYSWGSSAGSA